MPTVSFNTQFPGYHVLGELGRGNARVLKARHVETGDLVAIKHFALNTDPDTLRRFQRESEIMTGIVHPNIVRVREIRLDAELPYLVMELIEGGSVRQLLKDHRCLPVSAALRLGLQLLEAFRVIHERGIIHRDIKPENILYRQLPSGELHFLLTDFGIARIREQPATVTGQSLMTYEYASPEQFENPRNMDAATDYYSLGVVLYECLTGRVPFPMQEGVGIITFMNTVLTTLPPPVSLPDRQLPASLTKLLDGLLAKKAADRINNPGAVKVALKQAELEQLLLEEENPLNRSVCTDGEVWPPAVPVEKVITPPVESVRTSTATGGRPPAPARSSVTGGRVARWTLLGFLMLAAVAGTYYALTSRPKLRTTGPAPAVLLDSEEAPDTTARRQEEEARRQEQRRQALAAFKQVNVSVVNYRPLTFGGLRDVRIQVDNPTQLSFRHILVRVNYVKDNGALFKAENVYFYNVAPLSSSMKAAPDSRRGIRVTARITGYNSPEIPADTTQNQSDTTSHADGQH